MDSKHGRAALVAMPGNGSLPPLRRITAPASRCRPGDVAEWTRLEISANEAAELRDAAYTAGVPIDVWLAVMLEFSIALVWLSDMFGSADDVRKHLAHIAAVRPISVGVLPSWRVWQASLSGRTQTEVDELPEVVLPQRLIVRCAGRPDTSAAVKLASDWPLARMCELAAAGYGQTLEAFAFQASLEIMHQQRN